ncbi:MAG TPA: hypothetical protein VFU60_01110 [Ktedonobacterales bacterium]|nr:hypothetical protein [Ktedonobacterales bacterium]
MSRMAERGRIIGEVVGGPLVFDRAVAIRATGGWSPRLSRAG